MLSSAIIVFREVLEAALIIGVVMAATRGLSRRGVWVGAGILAGVAGAVVIAGSADVIAGAAHGVGQELLNAAVLLGAVLMIGWHNIWMQQHGRELAARMSSLGGAVRAGERPLYALAVVVGLAVLREGAEVVLFLRGIAAVDGSGAWALAAGGVLGLGAGALVGATLYLGLLRIPLRYLFAATGWLLLLLAAGMAAQAASFLEQAGYLPPLGRGLWNTSGILSEHSVIGQILHTLVGYVARPDGIQVLFYLVTAGLMALMMYRIGGRRPARSVSAAVAALIAGALAGAPDAAYAVHKVYSPIVERGELELEVRGDVETDGNAHKEKYEVGYGFTDRWFSALFVEYEKEPGEEYRHEATAWENIFQLTEQGAHWIDAGLYLEYEWPADADGADALEAKLLLEKSFGRAVHTANLVLKREVGGGSSDDTEFEYAWRTRWRLKPSFEPGIEFYGEPGELGDFAPTDEQEHVAGPVITGALRAGARGKLVYELGYLFGLTDSSPDGTVKWLIEYEGRF